MLRLQVRWGGGGFWRAGCALAVALAAGGPCAKAQQAAAGQSGAATVAAKGQSVSLPVDEDLPLQAEAPESLQELDSAANEATLAQRSVGDAGEDTEEGSAGVQRGEAADGAAASGLSYAGVPVTLNEGSLDGLSVQQSFRAGPRGGATSGARGGSIYNLQALQSFRAISQGAGPSGAGLEMFSAQYGGAGGRTQAVTRAGDLQMHGRAEWLTEESGLAAMNPYSVVSVYRNGSGVTDIVKPAGAMNQLNLAIGFPAAIRGLPERLRKSATLLGALDAQMREDNIVSSPANPDFFSLTPEQTALLGTRGVSAAATNNALTYLSSLTGTTSRTAYRLTGLLRGDSDVSTRDHLSLGFQGNRVDAVAGAALGQASDAVVARGIGSLGDSYVNVAAGSAHWLHRFSTRWDNEVRGQIAHDLEYEQARGPAPQEPAIGVGGFAPQVSIGPDGFAYGTPSNLGRIAYPDERRLQVADTLRWNGRRHQVIVGGDWSRIHDRIASVDAQEGAFLYDSGTTGGRDGGLVDWITDYTFNVNTSPNGGCPNVNAAVHDFCFRTYTQGFGAQATEFVTHELWGFAEDAMRVRDDLKLTFGVRYDYTLLPLPQRPNAVLDSDLAGYGITAATSRFPEDRNNFGPRFAAVWSPKWLSGTTVEAGYGVFFGRVAGGMIRAALADTAMASTTEHIRITPTTETQCPQIAAVNQGFGYPCAFISTPPAAVAQTTSATLFAKNFRSPMVQRGTLALEHAFAKRLRVRMDYALGYGTQLPATTDLNIATSVGQVKYVIQGGDAPGEHFPGLHTGEVFTLPLYAQRLISQYGAVTEVESNANTYYNAATAEIEWRGGRGLLIRGNYTFSKAIDDDPLQTATPALDSQFDPFANGYDKGLSSLQFPQRFAGSLSYQTQWSSGRAWERKYLAGWHVTAIGAAGSGAPYSYNVFGGTRLAGGHESINGSGGATYLPTVGRNTLHLPVRGKTDARLERGFAVGSRTKLTVFADAFNLLNERNITAVETRAFLLGSATTTGGPTPLLFQDAAMIASEGLQTQAFAAPRSSTTGSSKERRLDFGVRVRF